MSRHARSELAAIQPTWTGVTGVTQVVELQPAEQDWEVWPGVVVHGYAFNGQVPGPVVEATVGDTLLVRFANRLPEPTRIHWHGVRIPADIGGGAAADPVPPGGDVRYRFHLPDAGTFWYHAQRLETTQWDCGLYGAIVVRDPQEPALDGEQVLVFGELDLDQRGSSRPSTPFLESPRGRRGRVLLVNGVRQPQMQISAGHVERWRMVNAVGRYLRLSLEERSFHLVGTGEGLIPAPQKVDEVLMAPGDRFDVVVGPFGDGERLGLEALPHDEGGASPQGRPLATLHVVTADGVGSIVRRPATVRP